MTAEPSVTSMLKWSDLNSELRELAESHQAVLLRNISERKKNENGSPGESNTRVPSSPTVSEQVPEPEAEPEPSSKKVKRRGKPPRLIATYTFDRDKLPELLARSKEFVKKWHEPELLGSHTEERKKQIRERCIVDTIKYSKSCANTSQPTTPVYTTMEFRKSLIRHDWAAVKKLLKVLMRAPFRDDHTNWKIILTTLYYYPGAEAALREFIEQHRKSFLGSEILRGLLEINGMEPYTYKKFTAVHQQEDCLLWAPLVEDDHEKKKKSKKKKKKDDDVEIVVSNDSEGSN